MHWVCILQHDKTKEMYIDKTDDLKRRLREHQRGVRLQLEELKENGIAFTRNFIVQNMMLMSARQN